MSANDDNSKTHSGDKKATPAQPVPGPSGLNRPLGSIRPLGTTPTLGSRAIGNTAAPAGGTMGGPTLTRTGAPKMTFLPTVPVRRRAQQAETQSEPVAGPSTSGDGAARGGRGRGRGGAPGAGRGRGDVEMVASGPFALGPAASSGSYRKPANAGAAVGLMGPAHLPVGGSGLSQTAAPDIGGGRAAKKEPEDDEYAISEDEGGPGKVDMQRVGTLDYNAPVALKSRLEATRKEERRHKKKESARNDSMIMDTDETEGKDMKNALDLSESEEEEEVEDLAEHFARKTAFLGVEVDETAEPLYFFQFPHPFPSFVPDIDMTKDEAMQVDGESKKANDDDKAKSKSVTWAADVKVKEDADADAAETEKQKTFPGGSEGVAGEIEVYKSGAVKMRFGKDIVMDITAATQPAFLQQIVHVDLQKQRMSVFGNVERRFIVSPDIDTLLNNLHSGKDDKAPKAEAGLVGLERMDESRDVHDVAHKVTGVGSRDAKKAQEWIDKNITGEAHGEAKAYGSYEEVANASDVDAIYIGTPHTHHYDCAVASINAGKHVLVEKPATSNLAEWEALVQLSREKKVFLMEAMWTRFLPVTKAMKEVITSGELGELRVLHADLAGNFDINNIPKTHRILDPMLGGGALLDLGPYPLIWAILALYEDPRNEKRHPTRITGNMIKTKLTGVDSSTVFVLDFEHLDAQAILSCGITISSPENALIMRFSKGNIIVPRPIYRPDSFKVQKLAKEGSNDVAEEKEYEFKSKLVGGGWHFQADEVARCVRDGKLESDLWGLDKTSLEMKIFDEVRKQGGYVLPPGVEKVVA
ncbi:hypothetical protein FRC04_000663 [Tulasnella sp. 424]|nr:hypothetical protein FRC04_000663 [Tulasnella sp. 424]